MRAGSFRFMIDMGGGVEEGREQGLMLDQMYGEINGTQTEDKNPRDRVR